MAVTLELTPPVVVRTLPSGAVYAYPLGDPQLVCRASDLDEALAMQRLFLAEHLARVPADRLQSFAFPEQAVLHDIPVLVPRDDLDRRFGVTQPIAIPCVAIPDAEAWWVHVLPLRHVVHVAPGEDLRKRVVEEVTRQVAARELTPDQWAALLPGSSHALHRIAVVVKRGDHGDAGARAVDRRAREGERSRTAARELLERIGTDALKAHAKGRGPTILGRTSEVTRLGALLGGNERVGVALVGPSLAGKTAVLEALLSQSVVPFRSSPVFAMSGAALVAGQSGFGELAMRVRSVMEAAAALDAVLYFDNLADLFAGKSGGMEDLASALRPWIVEGRVRLVGECTAEAFEQFEKQQPALLACMHRVGVEPLDAKATAAILTERAAWARRSDPERPSLHDSAVVPLVELCERYLVDAAFPGKAVRLFEELRAIHRHDVDEAGNPHVIDVHDVHRAFSLRTGMPMFLLREDEQLRRSAIEDEFRRRVIGQREAIGRVTETLCTVKARLQPPGKPLANFLFVGPTGVGKTEVAKTLARILFGGPERMVRFDMSEYTDPWAAERLIRGTQRDDGELTRRIRQQPFSVLLLDEIEKAHPAVFDLLLQVLGEGRLTDARGRTTHFGNAIIIMTSNLGASHRPTGRSGSGFGGGDSQAAGDERRYYAEQVDRHFRPEFVNRIDRIIPFASLDRHEIAEVARVSLQRIRERPAFAQRGVVLEVADDALAELANRGYSPIYGARALRRELDDHLVAPIAGLLSEVGSVPEGACVLVALGAAGLGVALGDRRPDVTTTAGPLQLALVLPPAQRSRPTGVTQYSRLRRNATAALDIPVILELRQRAAYLTAELAGLQVGRPGHARTQGVASLREHQRITEALARVDAAAASIEAVEELAAGDGTGELAASLHDDATGAHVEFEVALVHAMLLGETRDAITLSLNAPHGPAALVQWLAWLDAWARHRRWTVTIHRAGETAPNWPKALPWGPPHSLARVREDFSTTAELAPWRELLVAVAGPQCGWWLGLEAGLHRLWPADRTAADHVWVRPIAAQASLGDADLLHRAMAPKGRGDEAVHRMTPTREVFADGIVTMPEIGLTSAFPLDLAAPGVLERLWFGDLVRRNRDSGSIAEDLPNYPPRAEH